METAKDFAAQVSSDSLLTSFFYIFSTLGVFAAIAGVIIFDAGLVKQKNVIDTIMQKIVAAFIGGMSFMLIGYGIWNWEIYQALGIPHPLISAIQDWGFFGHDMNTYAVHQDPAVSPDANLNQIFSIFFFTFAALTAAFLHSAGLERLKPSACYILAALVGGLVAPVLYYLTYSSTSFLTNNGMHDYVGIYSVYIFCGICSVVMSWMLGPRVDKDHASNYALVSIGGLLLILAIPALVIGNGFAEPGQGYYGITMNESGIGIIFINIFMALGAGTISGALIAYRLGRPSYVLLGTIGGYVSGTALFDIAMPWEMALVAFFAPFIILYTNVLLDKLGIDDPKIGPLTLGTGIYGALAAGIVGKGIPVGGFFGVTTGQYTFQHSHISLGMQAAGVVIIVGGGAAFMFIVLSILKATIGIRITAQEEKAGLDATYWSHAVDHHAQAAELSMEPLHSSL